MPSAIKPVTSIHPTSPVKDGRCFFEDKNIIKGGKREVKAGSRD